MRYIILFFCIGLSVLGLRGQISLPSWENRDLIVSTGDILVGNRESFRDGAAAFAKRVNRYQDTLDNGQIVFAAYESIHLEIQTNQPFGTKTMVDSTGVETPSAGYEMIFYRGRFADPGFKRELGRIHLPLQAVKTVATGEEEQTYYHSIDLANVPLLLLCDHRLARIDIHRIQYVRE